VREELPALLAYALAWTMPSLDIRTGKVPTLPLIKFTLDQCKNNPKLAGVFRAVDSILSRWPYTKIYEERGLCRIPPVDALTVQLEESQKVIESAQRTIAAHAEMPVAQKVIRTPVPTSLSSVSGGQSITVTKEMDISVPEYPSLPVTEHAGESVTKCAAPSTILGTGVVHALASGFAEGAPVPELKSRPWELVPADSLPILIAPEPMKAMRKPQGLTFTSHGEITLAEGCNHTLSQVAYTLTIASQELRKIRAFVGSNHSVTPDKLREVFSGTYLITSGGADRSDLTTWTEIFKKGPERATANNAALVWGEKKTGLNRNTIKSYKSRDRAERKRKRARESTTDNL
jgi:hypothetical protein